MIIFTIKKFYYVLKLLLLSVKNKMDYLEFISETGFRVIVIGGKVKGGVGMIYDCLIRRLDWTDSGQKFAVSTLEKTLVDNDFYANCRCILSQ